MSYSYEMNNDFYRGEWSGERLKIHEINLETRRSESATDPTKQGQKLFLSTPSIFLSFLQLDQ